MGKVRTRFAPSPSGYLHIGGARTALFNYLFARNQGGTFLLRIEDTDRERSTPESIEAILDSMRWLNLDWDEGPFYQSQRYPLYKEQAERLLSAGKAYRCYCAPAELEEKRRIAQSEGRKPVYDRACRKRTDHPAGQRHALRFAAPLEGEVVIHDLIKGPVTIQNVELDDLIIVRSDGNPIYNFCAVVDDALMEVSHIIRGEDHLVNTAKQIQMYEALGYPIPQFAHVPLVHGMEGGRLSKRHGATSVTAYRDMGYLPEALVNYLVRLGWSYGDQEIFQRAELIEKFSIERVGSAAGAFNPEKLAWVNSQHLRNLTPEELAEAVKPFIAQRGWSMPGDDQWLVKMVVTLRERVNTLVELLDFGTFYFTDTIEIEPKAAAKHLASADRDALLDLRAGLAALPDWNAATIQNIFEHILEQRGLKLGQLAQPVRVALTGGTVSPGIYEVIDVIGRDRVLARLDAALTFVHNTRPLNAQGEP